LKGHSYDTQAICDGRNKTALEFLLNPFPQLKSNPHLRHNVEPCAKNLTPVLRLRYHHPTTITALNAHAAECGQDSSLFATSDKLIPQPAFPYLQGVHTPERQTDLRPGDFRTEPDSLFSTDLNTVTRSSWNSMDFNFSIKTNPKPTSRTV
jgi:hypothetical protein